MKGDKKLSHITSLSTNCACLPSVKETCQSPGKVVAVALGILSIIGAAVAAGVLYGYVSVGNVAFHSLWGVPVGFSLIILSYFYKNTEEPEPAAAELPPQNGENKPAIATDSHKPSAELPPQIKENIPMVAIGSLDEPLDEKGIREALWALKDKKGITSLIIYGSGKIDYEKKPGRVCMYPQQIILRGEKMISDACHGVSNEPAWLIGCLTSPAHWPIVEMPNPEAYFIEVEFELSSVEKSGSDTNRKWRINYKILERS